MIELDLKASGDRQGRRHGASPRLPLSGQFHPGESIREKDSDYSKVVGYLSDKQRLIVCSDSMQWILQNRRGDEWRAELYFRQEAGLRLFVMDGAAIDSMLAKFTPPLEPAQNTLPEASQSVEVTFGLPRVPKSRYRTQRRLPEALRGTAGGLVSQPSAIQLEMLGHVPQMFDDGIPA